MSKKTIEIEECNRQVFAFYMYFALFEFTGDPTSVGEIREVEKTELKSYMLGSYPNPFNSTTMIQFGLPSSGDGEKVVLKAFDIMGRTVATLVDGYVPHPSYMTGGAHEFVFDASDLASGIYIFVCKA